MSSLGFGIIDAQAMSTTWQEIHEVPSIRARELHIWLIKVDSAIENFESGHLSEYEILRAQNLRHPVRRAEFISSRTCLRSLLGKYLEMDPATVDIMYSGDGKPSVGAPIADLKFNLSHSGDKLLIAFSEKSDVGADIERVDANAIDDGTVKRVLHPDEMQRYRSLSEMEKSGYFFECWTKKEAFLKLLGCGFAIEPSEIHLQSIISNGKSGSEDIFFTELPPVPGYRASVATHIEPIETRFYTPSLTLFE